MGALLVLAVLARRLALAQLVGPVGVAVVAREHDDRAVEDLLRLERGHQLLDGLVERLERELCVHADPVGVVLAHLRVESGRVAGDLLERVALHERRERVEPLRLVVGVGVPRPVGIAALVEVRRLGQRRRWGVGDVARGGQG